MDAVFWIGVALALVPSLLGIAFVYGRLHGKVMALEDKMSTNKENQDERDKRQDARTKVVESKLDAHAGELSDVKVLLTGISTNMDHVVKAVDKLTGGSD